MINTTTNAPENLNTSWINLRGTWITKILLVCTLKLAYSMVPGMTAEVSWTLTNLTYNIVSYYTLT